MEDEIYSKGEEKSRRWSKEVSTPDGMTKKISVEEISNGYLICIYVYGDKEGKYYSKEKKYFSEENPLETEKTKTSKNLDGLKKLVADSFFDLM